MRLHSFSTYETSYNRHGTILVLKTFTSMDWAHVSALQNLQSCKMSNVGQWLWLSWKSGCFRLQRSTVRIQSSAKIILIIYCQLLMKRRKWRKSDREWPIFIKNVKTLMRYLVAFKKFSPDEFTRKISSCPRHLYDPTFWMTGVEGIYTDPLTTTTGHLNNDFCYKSVAVLLPSNLSFCNWFHESLLSTEH